MSKLYGTDTYQLRLRCSNCSLDSIYSIAKGTSYDKVTCKNCGCTDLHRITSPFGDKL